MDATLLTTIGSEPQVITITLSLLAKRGYAISDLIIIHTDPAVEPIKTALQQLEKALNAPHPSLPPCRYHYHPITASSGQLLNDIDGKEGAEATFRVIYQQALQVKKRGSPLHFGVIGGRKVMSIYAMTTAQLLFDEHDHFWYLVSHGALLKEKRMFPEPGDQADLYEIPVVRWSHIPPTLTEIGELLDPEQALQAAESRTNRTHQRRLHRFVEERLTPAERETVAAAAQNPAFTYKILGEYLHKEVGTVNTQLQNAYRKLEEELDIERVTRPKLNRLLADYPW